MFFYSEIYHFANLLSIFLARSIFYVGIGLFIRSMIKTKKEFYKTSVYAVFVWLICEIVYAIIFGMNILSLIGIAGFCFMLSWPLFCGLIGAWVLHLICFVLHKKVIE
jgi:hypothetical protein